MWHWESLTLLPEAELAQRDIAAVNLACAAGLPDGPTDTETAECLKRLDEYTAVAHKYTERCFPQFTRNPGNYRNSEGYFRTLCMVTVLWQRCGVYYDLAKVPEDVPLDTWDVFIHGPLLGKGGTCASLPVVYAAVGRRLGYPIKLATTETKTVGHVFARWDDLKGERFNIDVNATGLSSLPDDYYRTGDFQMSPQKEREGGFLKRKTPREELAGFLGNRASQWRQAGQHRLAVDTLAHAAARAQPIPNWLNTLLRWMHEWQDELNKKKPGIGFPQLWLYAQQRRYPSLPVDVEEGILALELTEKLLNAPDLETRWWKLMRQGRSVLQPPQMFRGAFSPTQECQISFRY
jgi:hypothetical protein